jgi:hypothetical protein
VQHLVESRVRRSNIVHARREHHEVGITEQLDEAFSISFAREAYVQTFRQHERIRRYRSTTRSPPAFRVAPRC